MIAALQIVKPGLLTTVQDAGRWGHQASGVPVAGAMDPFAYRLANALAGNARGAAALEVTLLGPEIVFEDPRRIAITGARLACAVDGTSIPHATAVTVGPGARLRFGARTSGARAYLAIEGGIDVPPVLDSRSTHVPSAMGGWHGRALRAGDHLPLGPVSHTRTIERKPASVSARSAARHDQQTVNDQAVVIRVLPGPHLGRFTPDAIEALQSSPYVVSRDADRMGFRLRGPALRPAETADITSDATPLGAVQVPGSGEPILLMADRQTTGGYPIIAIMISADVPLAAQLAPGDRVRFVSCTAAEALSALIALERELLAVEA